MNYLRFILVLAVLVGIVFLWGRFLGVSHRQYQKIKVYVENQIEQKAVVHKVGPDGMAPQFVVFFAHGFLGFNSFSGQDSWNEFVHRMAPGLRGMSYLVYHPGFIQTKDVQTFSQESDVYQARLHLEFLIDKVQGKGVSKTLQGHAVSGLPILCVGHSNGSATLLSLFSYHKNLAYNVRGLVLLAPYADLSAVSTMAKVGRWAGDLFARIGFNLLYAPSYNPFGSSPLQQVKNGDFASTLPTLIVSNRNDRVVYFKNRELLAQAFGQQKKYSKTVQFLDMETGGHNWAWKRSVVHKNTQVRKNIKSKKLTFRLGLKHCKYLTYLQRVDRMRFQKAIAAFVRKYIV
ncbi:hypothetical protein FJ366_00080 [Candidatus Dependentiae bacterium]|nr:hypothetical protein [Candidatus Dependentiae bacterium]